MVLAWGLLALLSVGAIEGVTGVKSVVRRMLDVAADGNAVLSPTFVDRAAGITLLTFTHVPVAQTDDRLRLRLSLPC